MTFLEITIAVAIFSTIVLSVFGLFHSSTDLYRQEIVHTYLNGQSRKVLDAISRDVIESSASGLSPAAPFNSPSLRIRRVAGYDAETRAVQLAPDVRYAIEGAAIVRYEGATRMLLTDDAVGLTFTLSGNSVIVSVTLARTTARGQRITYERNETLLLRN